MTTIFLAGWPLSREQAALEHPECDVFYGDSVFVNEQGSGNRPLQGRARFRRKGMLHFQYYIPSTTTLVRRRVLDGGYLLDCDYRVCMDFEYFLRLAHAGFRFHYVPRFVAAFRWHGCNVSLQQTGKRQQERLQVQRNFGGRQYSPAMLEFLADVHRVKRVMRKVVSGNIAREFRVREMLGRDTRWQCGVEGSDTCASLACL